MSIVAQVNSSAYVTVLPCQNEQNNVTRFLTLTGYCHGSASYQLAAPATCCPMCSRVLAFTKLVLLQLVRCVFSAAFNVLQLHSVLYTPASHHARVFYLYSAVFFVQCYCILIYSLLVFVQLCASFKSAHLGFFSVSASTTLVLQCSSKYCEINLRRRASQRILKL